MKRVTYSQLWMRDQVSKHAPITVEQVFKQAEVEWLRDQGFAHRFYNDYEYSQDVVQFNLEFTIPDDALTYLCLRWPKPRQIVEY
jgi:hypothetical protein